MIEIRPFETLGYSHNNWLHTRHHFSFADYYEPTHVHLGYLRVWNDDTLTPHHAFPAHFIENMEIITYVYEGALTYRDNLGHDCRIEAGNIHIISAGTGLIQCVSNEEPVSARLFQLWIMPNKVRTPPDQTLYLRPTKQAHCTLIASGIQGESAPLTLHADAKLIAMRLKPNESMTYPLTTSLSAYLVAAKGRFALNSHIVNAHDGITIRNESHIKLTAIEESDILLLEVE